MSFFKRSEREIRDIHEREYDKFLSNLRKQRSYSNISYLQNDNLREIEYFNRKSSRNRENQYKRIQQDNLLLLSRLIHVQGKLMTKEEYERDWQRHIEIMKKTCQYPENIDRFISK